MDGHLDVSLDHQSYGGRCWAFMADSRSMSLTGRLIVRVSAFSQRTGNIRIKRNETSIANGREGGERADTCSDTFVSRMGNLSHILWSEPRIVNQFKNEFNSTKLYLLQAAGRNHTG